MTALPNDSEVESGTAVIKKEYIYHADISTQNLSDDKREGEPDSKRSKIDEPGNKKARGQNKGRYRNKAKGIAPGHQLCRRFVDIREGVQLPTCPHPNCKDIHDVQQYLSSKPPDIGNVCYVFKAKGHCPRGVTCRFGSEHLTEDGRNKVSDGFIESSVVDTVVLKKDLQIALRKKKYNFDKANSIVDKVWNDSPKVKEEDSLKSESANITRADGINCKDEENVESSIIKREQIESENIKVEQDKNSVQDDCSMSDKDNLREKKIINWKGKLYLAPLTTLGNLPFRRVCKEWGADITCSEMAMALPILQGAAHEWALLRRHKSEDLFGVQICGNNPHMLARCAQVIEENVGVDFIDLNLGCPIELVYQKGGGSGLLRREKQLAVVVRSMAQVTSVPLTVKTRTGIYADKKVAHLHMPLYTSAGASLVVVHGRTREQRYTRTADWDYIEECAKLAAPTPVFGNGDILSYSDYNQVMSTYPDVAGVMVGRGALYKPWIFTEIKEQRDWDISSSERLDILRKFVNYGFEHWGCDTKGVENTRRFLLEWLSFLYRYIPVGLLERPPQRINERPPRYVGRDDLETLMASANCADWVKISELLCGPVPEGFQFLPKHKANAWAAG